MHTFHVEIVHIHEPDSRSVAFFKVFTDLVDALLTQILIHQIRELSLMPVYVIVELRYVGMFDRWDKAISAF
jgi:hypothetical protein